MLLQPWKQKFIPDFKPLSGKRIAADWLKLFGLVKNKTTKRCFARAKEIVRKNIFIYLSIDHSETSLLHSKVIHEVNLSINYYCASGCNMSPE